MSETTARLRAAATKSRNEGGDRNVAVAAWLNGLADRIDGRDRPASPEHEQNVREALAVADVILGGLS